MHGYAGIRMYTQGYAWIREDTHVYARIRENMHGYAWIRVDDTMGMAPRIWVKLQNPVTPFRGGPEHRPIHPFPLNCVFWRILAHPWISVIPRGGAGLRTPESGKTAKLHSQDPAPEFTHVVPPMGGSRGHFDPECKSRSGSCNAVHRD